MYAITIALNHQEINHHPERIPKLIPFIPKYNWDDEYFTAKSKYWEKFENNNESIALKILCVPNNSNDIRLAYKSEYNGKREEKLVLLMIGDTEKWHYLAVKNLPRLMVIIII